MAHERGAHDTLTISQTRAYVGLEDANRLRDALEAEPKGEGPNRIGRAQEEVGGCEEPCSSPAATAAQSASLAARNCMVARLGPSRSTSSSLPEGHTPCRNTRNARLASPMAAAALSTLGVQCAQCLWWISASSSTSALTFTSLHGAGPLEAVIALGSAPKQPPYHARPPRASIVTGMELCDASNAPCVDVRFNTMFPRAKAPPPP